MYPSNFQRGAQDPSGNRILQRFVCQITGLRFRVRDAQQWKRQIAHLGSENEEEYRCAGKWVLERAETAMPTLYHALRRSPAIACGAAGLLHHLGDPQGVRHVLLRAYQDEWFTYYPARDIAEYGTQIGMRIGKAPICQTVRIALEEAPGIYDEQLCLQTLIVALSGLRALGIMASHRELEDTPIDNTDLWKQALQFGPMRLQQRRQWPTSLPLLTNMTGWIRAEAIRNLLREHDADKCLSLLSAALEETDKHVVRSAMDGLQCLGDHRAVPALEAIAFVPGHPLALHARHAIECLAGPRAEVLTLVRASREELAAEELLRPARSTSGDMQTQELSTLLHVSE